MVLGNLPLGFYFIHLEAKWPNWVRNTPKSKYIYMYNYIIFYLNNLILLLFSHIVFFVCRCKVNSNLFTRYKIHFVTCYTHIRNFDVARKQGDLISNFNQIGKFTLYFNFTFHCIKIYTNCSLTSCYLPSPSAWCTEI